MNCYQETIEVGLLHYILVNLHIQLDFNIGYAQYFNTGITIKHKHTASVQGCPCQQCENLGPVCTPQLHHAQR